jgi:PAS domain S-box-containing protein
MISANAAMTGSYDSSEVARSVLIAIAASYAALDLAGRVTAASGRIRLAWLGCGAAAMGIGIWAMHFKGMLAFHLPVTVEYQWPTVLASLLVAILASAVALYVASRQHMGRVEALTGSLIMGGGIAGMHYIGMAAMRSPAITRFSPPPDLFHAVSISPVANNGIAIVTLIVIMAAMVTSSMDRRAAAGIQRLNQELERRVAERTLQLEAVNQALRKEIAERERAQEAVRRSEDRLRLVVDTLPAMVWSKLPDGCADFLNQRFREYTGFTLEEGLGWGWMNAFHPEDRAEEEWRAAFAAGEPFEKEARLRRADGLYRWFLLRAAPLRDERGNVVKWYGTITDIEDRRRAEEALQEEQDKLAHVTRTQAMGGLAAAIAHEVNQPLTAIVTNANFSLRQLKSSTANLDELRTAITEIVDDATRASAVISRIRGLLVKGSPRRMELDINRVIQEVITLLRNELTRNRVSLRTDFASNLPQVSGDPVQLQQVLINLVVNAIEAMRFYTDRTRELRIRSVKNADGILVQLQDSGPGMKPELADGIFEPFFTTKAEGIGMGLAISRSIIESHGGQLSLVSASQGTLFQFILPINPKDAS